MRIGVFGGTFDPVHIGHLITAEECREQLELDRVLFVPANQPPHKPGREITPFHHRVEMLQFAIAGNPAFAVDECEGRRQPPSYTVDTLRELHRREPGNAFYLIMGADMLIDFPTWHRPQEICSLATLAVTTRPGWQIPPFRQITERLGLRTEGVHIRLVETPQIGISATDLRRRVRDGRSIRYQTPRPVEIYIHEKHLYRIVGS